MGAGDRYYSSFVHEEVEASRNAFVNGRSGAAFDVFHGPRFLQLGHVRTPLSYSSTFWLVSVINVLDFSKADAFLVMHIIN